MSCYKKKVHVTFCDDFIAKNCVTYKKKSEVGFIFEDISTDAEDLYAWFTGHLTL